MGAPFLVLGWDLWVLDGITVVWQVAGRGSPQLPPPLLSPVSMQRAGTPRREWSVLQWAGSLLPCPAHPAWAGGPGRVQRPCGQASSNC